MREHLNFTCEDETLIGTLDNAAGSVGLLIVSGGNELRSGAHRGQAGIAADIAAQGYPVFRFDRRGVGDSSGENREFLSSAPDLTAAIAAFKTTAPHVTHIVAFGNCDAAAALAIHAVVERPCALILSNPWVIEESGGGGLNPDAVRSRYWRKLKDPVSLLRLISGKVDFKKLSKGLAAAGQRSAPSGLVQRISHGLTGYAGSIDFLVAQRDTTGSAFLAAWRTDALKGLRNAPNVTISELDSATHSYASDEDRAWLRAHLINRLSSIKNQVSTVAI